MTCTTCEDLRAQVRELEATLDRAIYVYKTDRGPIVSALGVSGQQADLVALLYRAGDYIRTGEIEAALPRCDTYGAGGQRAASDEEFRGSSFVGAVVAQSRRRLPPNFIESRQGLGYRLSDHARERVHQILNPETRQ